MCNRPLLAGGGAAEEDIALRFAANTSVDERRVPGGRDRRGLHPGDPRSSGDAQEHGCPDPGADRPDARGQGRGERGAARRYGDAGVQGAAEVRAEAHTIKMRPLRAGHSSADMAAEVGVHERSVRRWRLGVAAE